MGRPRHQTQRSDGAPTDPQTRNYNYNVLIIYHQRQMMFGLALVVCLVASAAHVDAAISAFAQTSHADVTETDVLAGNTDADTTTLTLAEDFVVTNIITTITVTGATGGITWASSNAAFTATGGEIKVGALNYETAISLTTTIKATDTVGPATIDLTVMVTDVNDVQPAFTAVSYAETVTDASAAGTTVATVTASDGDGPTFNTTTYEISAGNTDTVFEVTNDGVIKIATGKAVDRATLKGYALIMLAKDAGTAGTTQQTGTATVILGVCPSKAAAVVASVAVILLTAGVTILS